MSATVAWSGAGYAISNLAYSEDAGILTATWDTLVASDSRGINTAGVAIQDPDSVTTPTLSHTLYFTPLDGDFSGANYVQSGDGVSAPFTGGTIALDSVTNSAAALISVTPAG